MYGWPGGREGVGGGGGVAIYFVSHNVIAYVLLLPNTSVGTVCQASAPHYVDFGDFVQTSREYCWSGHLLCGPVNSYLSHGSWSLHPPCHVHAHVVTE